MLPLPGWKMAQENLRPVEKIEDRKDNKQVGPSLFYKTAGEEVKISKEEQIRVCGKELKSNFLGNQEGRTLIPVVR